MSSQKNALIKRVGEDIYQKYYLNSGNEARIKKAYDNRDPRLQQTVRHSLCAGGLLQA